MDVSVCICTYNQAPYLIKAVRSVVAQTYPPVEIIISDDCSTDETHSLLNQLLDEVPLLKVIRQPVNLGIAKNTDFCLRLAKGQFIIRLDSDDYLAPEYTKKLVNLLAAYPEAGYAHAAVQEIDKNGSFLSERKLFRKSGFQSSMDALKASIKGYRVAANIIMFRREALVKVDYLTGRPNFGEDYHVTASISAAGFGNVYLNEVLAFYRIWTDERGFRVKRKMAEIAGIRQVFEEVVEPAYNQRGWSLEQVNEHKMRFACQHADCLGWRIYSEEEKRKLVAELLKLSSVPMIHAVIWLYSHGLGTGMTLYFKALHSLKLYMRKVFLCTYSHAG